MADKRVDTFTAGEIALAELFRDQAAIVIENVRLFEAEQHRTRELSESLEQQTATSEVLQVISGSPGDLQPVLASMLANAIRICDAQFGNIYRWEGEKLHSLATHNTPSAFAEARQRISIRPGGKNPLGQMIATKKLVHTLDMAATESYADREPVTVAAVELGGVRTLLAVPMVKENQLVGAFTLARREVVLPFTDKQIALVENFAAQAVIAIENARLLNELRQRTTDLSELLEQQTATSEVLGVISRSKFELQPILQSVVDTAARLCRADSAVIFRLDRGLYRFAAGNSLDPTYLEIERQTPISPGSGTVIGRAALSRQVAQIDDAWADQLYEKKHDAKVGSVRSMIGVPLMREGEPIGVIGLGRRRVEPFTEREIELVTTFADQAVIAIENVRLFEAEQKRTWELSESLEQQTATAEVLQVISSSPGDLQPVFEAMLENAVRICGAMGGAICRWDGDALRHVAIKWARPAFADFLMRTPIHPNPKTHFGRMLATKTVVHVSDLAADPAYTEQREPGIVTAVEVGHIRTALYVPMLKERELVGAFTMACEEVRAFTDKQIELVQNFAAQAVIAIENTRLLTELRESLQQQTATADVLKVISRSTFDLQSVLDTLIGSAVELCDAVNGTICLREGDGYRYRASSGIEGEWAKFLEEHPPTPGRGSLTARVLLSGHAESVPDVLEDPEYVVPLAAMNNTRSVFGVPLLRHDIVEGVLLLARTEPGLFNQRQIELVQTFADQAVIAIENTRLLTELRESLQQQTATADVLKVISRSTFDLQTVLDTLTESAVRLCTADRGVIFQRDGGLFRFGANYGFSREAEQYALEHPLPVNRGSITGRVALEGRAIHVPDILADHEYQATGYQRAFGYRTNLGVPLLREGTTIGVFSLTRDEVSPFTEKQIELATTFADQAVIAIENVRLFEAEQQRTRELSEALEQQMATAEVLRVISSSPGDLQPVFASMLENAVRICDAQFGNIYRWDGDALHLAAAHNIPPAFAEFRGRTPLRPNPNLAMGRMVATKAAIHVADNAAEQAYIEREPSIVAAVELGGVRTYVGVPMLKGNELIGAVTVYRQEVRPFTDKQIELVQNFAAQAVIAIENTRLLTELREETADGNLGGAARDFERAR